ncbi:hypothetical protein [uncultured Methanoregula sp.]|uniref:hypothetical protein n=1 Tax=uncultured Methanoregula sp. TaxID=1005933 RepID=UPI002AABCB21|nr:hypothetical protein [uncultured Methanoregula sp.]
MNKTKTPDKSNNLPSHPQNHSKKEIIAILREENPPIDGDDRFSQLFLIVEYKKINANMGIIKGELYNNDQLDYRGSLLIPILNNTPDQPNNNWASLEIGKSMFYGISFDARELCLTERIGEFIHRSIDEGKLQDFLPFTGSK